jgi:hypothetical protein
MSAHAVRIACDQASQFGGTVTRALWLGEWTSKLGSATRPRIRAAQELLPGLLASPLRENLSVRNPPRESENFAMSGSALPVRAALRAATPLSFDPS